MTSITLKEIAERVGGEIIGHSDTRIQRAAALASAVEGDISFFANRKYKKWLAGTKASAVVVGEPSKTPAAQLVVPDPYYTFTRIMVMLHGHRQHPEFGISTKASIAESARWGEGCRVGDFVTLSEGATLGERCVVYPNVFVGPNVKIGDDCVLYPNAVIHEGTRIGNRVIVQANATIGGDGFGFATHQGQHHKIPHLGKVILEDDVEIGSGCTVERGALDDTIIGQGAKLGDLVVIGHATRVGEGALVVAQAGIAGSTTLGAHCRVGGQAGIAGHLNIGDRVGIAGQSGVMRDVPKGLEVMGTPAFEMRRAQRALLLLKSLPDMRRRLRALEKIVNDRSA